MSSVRIPSFIRRRMPNATEVELLEATEAFKRYINVVIRIHERRELEQTAIRGELDREVQ